MNDAYDNLDSMAMGNTNRGSSEYAEPVTPNGTHPSAQTAPRQDPAAFFTGKHSKKKNEMIEYYERSPEKIVRSLMGFKL